MRSETTPGSRGAEGGGDDAWHEARAIADLIVRIPSCGESCEPEEMFFRRIPATGRDGFRMGSRDGGVNEEPPTRVVIEGEYYLGTFVVTQGQWRAMWPHIEGLYSKRDLLTIPPDAAPTSIEGSRFLPRTGVSWIDAVFYVRRLDAIGEWIGGRCMPAKERMRFGLPTEAEWERACRGDGDTDYWIGDGPAALGDVGWFGANAGYRVHAVTQPVVPGNPESHPFGLFGMHGNVWEWCHDQLVANAGYREMFDGNVDEAGLRRFAELDHIALHGLPPEDHYHRRVCRGGSRDQPAGWCRSSQRKGAWPDDRNHFLGFRVCLVIRD